MATKTLDPPEQLRTIQVEIHRIKTRQTEIANRKSVLALAVVRGDPDAAKEVEALTYEGQSLGPHLHLLQDSLGPAEAMAREHAHAIWLRARAGDAGTFVEKTKRMEALGEELDRLLEGAALVYAQRRTLSAEIASLGFPEGTSSWQGAAATADSFIRACHAAGLGHHLPHLQSASGPEAMADHDARVFVMPADVKAALEAAP